MEKKIHEAWESADFGYLSNIPRSLVGEADGKLIAEAQAAVELISRANSSYRPQGRHLSASSGLKIVTVLHSSLPHHPGGYSNRAQGLLAGLSEHGVKLASYTRPGFYREIVDSNATEPFPIDWVGPVKYTHLSTPFPRGRGEFRYMVECIDEYLEILKREAPNILHVRSTYLIALPAMIAAHSLGIPVLYEVSGLWELVYEGRGEQGRAARTAIMENVTVANADRTVTMNKSMAQLLRSRASNEVEIGLVPNAVDPSRFSSVRPMDEVSDPVFTVGYIGSLVDYEGLDVLLHAISYLRDQGFECPTKIVGRGAESRRLRELSDQLDLRRVVTFTGPVPADEVVEHFNDVKIVVLPRKSTPATECVTPLKPFEAMAAKRPLVVSSVGALQEVSREGSVAKVFKAGDHVGLANAIVELSNSPEQQEKMVKSAFDLVTSDHSWSLVGEMMYKELHSVATQPPRLKKIYGKTHYLRRGDLTVATD